LKAIALSYYEAEEFSIVKQFNNFAKENGIDIRVKVDICSQTNSSLFVDDYGSEIEFLMKRKSNKYDIIFYDVMYSPRYAPYFLDLSQYLPKDHMALYSSTVANQTCTYEGKWVGLVSLKSLQNFCKLLLYVNIIKV